ncbi:hypothetical protein FB45DRAFT_1033334 [Roridomyces roridus]|uniref:DUF6533 domain-containing protein n=1 Tax=Roridomyces roridus TaxID=1738132 RepID=A0AAD7FEN2_9AGAR|nr:hypothetical protein FB45DRAFT_1033334 [Roridomyces roridus]
MNNHDLENFQIVAYVRAAFLCLLVYDTLLQASQEHLHIWKSRWSVVKCLYLWTRYAAYVDTSLGLFLRVDSTPLPSLTCDKISIFNTVFGAVGITIAEVILMIRTYALYGRSKKLLAFFVILFLSIGGVNLWAVLGYSEATAFESGNSCDSNDPGNKTWIVCYTSFLAVETIIVSLTLRKACKILVLADGLDFLRHPSKLVATFYRDGIFFYLAILSIFIIDVVLKVAIARPALQDIGDSPLRVLHSILACRLVIHVRHIAAEEDGYPSTGSVKSPIMFAKIKGESPTIV